MIFIDLHDRQKDEEWRWSFTRLEMLRGTVEIKRAGKQGETLKGEPAVN